MENNVNEVVEKTEETMEEVGSKLMDIKPEGKWVAISAAGCAAVIGIGVGIKKLVDKKKASDKLVEKADKKPWALKLPKIHLGKKSKETTETEENQEQE